ncbi:MAG: phosphatidylserine decarboxylase [Gemmatimonadota bacterium]|nr:phosphatidylserine decarboxylase [Gemmatimonadota bacterium]
MSKSLKEWVETDVARVKAKPLKWISEEHFFRDPSRPMFSDDEYFFSPADGIIIYQREVQPADCIVDIKGKAYSLRLAMQDDTFDRPCLVVGVFMTMYDVHVNRLPYAGFLSHKQLDAITTFNRPMLDIERSLVDDLTIDHSKAEYLHSNQRMLNRVYAPDLQQYYYILQIADYDVDCVTPFRLNQNAIVDQNERFSQIRFGSQVDLIVPLSERYRWELMQETGAHVEAGLDPLIRIVRKA